MTTRFRTRGNLRAFNVADHWYSSDKVACQGNLVRTDRGLVTYSDTEGVFESMSDVVTKNYQKLSSQGRVIMSPMSTVRMEHAPAVLGGPVTFKGNFMQCGTYQSVYEFPPCYTLQGLTRFEFTRSANGYPIWPVGSLLTEGERSNAVYEAATKCRNMRGRPVLTLWETLAERKRSQAMLGEYLKATTKAVDGAYNDLLQNRSSRKRFIGLKKVSQAAAAGWLITRYGLKPLMSDLLSLVSQLKREVDQADRHTARGKAIVGRSETTLSVVLPPGDHVQGTYRYVLTDEVTVRAMSLDEWRISTMEHVGVDAKGLITLPWELLTLSFVADWFINVGDFLGAIVPLPGVNQLGSCYVETRVRSLSATCTGFSGVGIAEVSSGGAAQKVGTLIEKSRVPGLPGPKLVVLNRSLLSPELDKNWVRQADACALIGQRLLAISRLR